MRYSVERPPTPYTGGREGELEEGGGVSLGCTVPETLTPGSQARTRAAASSGSYIASQVGPLKSSFEAVIRATRSSLEMVL